MAGAAAASATLRDRIGALQARLSASDRFRRWAERFPLTRPIARRRAAALFDLCAGFVYAQALSAALRLGLFEMVRERPMPAVAISLRAGLPLASTTRLLEACVALRLLARRTDGAYGLGALGAAMVDNPGVAAMVGHHALLYEDLRDPVALLRAGRGEALSGFWAYAGTEAGAPATGVDPYGALMAASQPMVAAQVADAYAIGQHRHVLDIGGGEGRFVIEVAPRAPETAFTLFDLPPVADRARARFAAAGLAARSSAEGGDFRADPLPPGADLVTLVRVLHDHDDAVVRALLGKVRAALPSGGRILIAEPMAGTPGAERVGAYFALYLLAMGQGRLRSAAELAEMLRAAGFAQPRLLRVRMPLIASVMVADVMGD
ncbi:methyltransferase domain-containing protein [Roseomonas sp. JC162]|uniref:Methyltransferase domain-containing protein n=1 Tax=Neoroseomonas marina TaxID=1232220 RepID=A0A848EJ28_9PROT|nr:methyltransferase domain-containing protein [Neoroseomonas marina]